MTFRALLIALRNNKKQVRDYIRVIYVAFIMSDKLKHYTRGLTLTDLIG